MSTMGTDNGLNRFASTPPTNELALPELGDLVGTKAQTKSSSICVYTVALKRAARGEIHLNTQF